MYANTFINERLISQWEQVPTLTSQVAGAHRDIVFRIAGRLLQNARLLCPVDTGALRASLKVRPEDRQDLVTRVYLESPLIYFVPVLRRTNFGDEAVSLTVRDSAEIVDFVLSKSYRLS